MVKVHQGTLSPSITNTTVHQKNWNFTPPRTISQLLVIYNILETNPTAKLLRCWEKNPRIKPIRLSKNTSYTICVQMIVLFISGWFSGLLLLDGWMVVLHFHDLAEPLLPKARRNSRFLFFFFSFFSGSNLRSKYVKVTYWWLWKLELSALLRMSYGVCHNHLKEP